VEDPKPAPTELDQPAWEQLEFAPAAHVGVPAVVIVVLLILLPPHGQLMLIKLLGFEIRHI
jgi:hypothetical protein